MSNKSFLVFDLETLGRHDNAVILSLGLVAGQYREVKSLEEYIATGLYLEFDVQEQIEKHSRAMDDDTLNWWSNQTGPAADVLKTNTPKVSLDDFQSKCTSFLKSIDVNPKECDVYDRNAFDMSKLKHHVEVNLKDDVFWGYQNVMELSTAFKFLGYDRYGGLYPNDVTLLSFIYHNALHDAALDAFRLQNVLIDEFSDNQE